MAEENEILIAIIYMLLFVVIVMTIIVGILSVTCAIVMNEDAKTNKKTHL